MTPVSYAHSAKNTFPLTSTDMPYSASDRPHIQKLLLRLTILLVLFVLATVGVVLAMHNYSLTLTKDSQKTLLPAIHDHQRAALNLERLERMGDLVTYGGNIRLIRKNALAAQVLAFQPSFNFSPEAKATVQSAFELLREIQRTRQQLLSNRFAQLSPIEQENLTQLERTLQIRWGEYKQALFEQQNKIISNATSLQERNLLQITATNNLILIVAGAGISLLLIIFFIIGYNLNKHLITPVTQASQALSALEKGQQVPASSARYQELNNIHQAVFSLACTMKTLHNMATRDSLTGCVNRGHFMTLAQAALATAHQQKKPLALVMLDIDHFKRVNDLHGHATGDKTLKLCTQWIKQALPKEATLGRIGGEEFALILPGFSAAEANILSNDIRNQIANKSSDNPDVPAITISLGVEVITQATDEVDTLLSQADKALYQAKSSGRNRVVMSQTIQAQEATETL